MPTSKIMLEAALHFAEQGFTVFPASGKASFKSKKFSGGVNWGATKEPAQIKKDFAKFKNANIGLPTGLETGFFVVEADTPLGHEVDGITSLSALEAEHGPLPATLMAKSPSGSVHYYFKWPAGVTIKNSASEIAPGVDVRGQGGMVIAPPSVKPDVGVYEWMNDLPIAEAPAAWLELCREQPRKRKLDGVRAIAAPPPEKIAAAVAVLPNEDIGWEDWNRIAMAIYAATEGSQAGFELFTQWSKKSTKYDAGATDERWEKLHRSPPDEIGVATLFYLASQAAPGWWPDDPDIIKLNEKHALVIVGDKSVIMNTAGELSFMTVSAFGLWYGNRYVNRNEKKMELGKYWLHHPHRRQYQGLTFSPHQELPGQYNLWRGFAVEPKAGDCEKLLAHIKDNVCGGDDDLFRWVVGWFADIIQHPAKKIGTSLVLRGKQGTGKTIVGKAVGSLLGPHYFPVSTPRLITGRFNAHHTACLLLHAEEACWAGDHEAESKIKDLVTGEDNFIEFKGKEIIRVRNYVRLLVSGNPDWLIPAGFEERRFAVLDMGVGRMQDLKYFTAIKTQLDNGGRAALLHYLLNFDLTTVELRTIPITAALRDQKISSLTSENAWWLDFLHRGELPWGCDEPNQCPVAALFDRYIHHAQKQGARRRAIETALGMFLNKNVPGLLKTDIMHKVRTFQGGAKETRGNVYSLPTLEDCRKAFADRMQQDLDWDARTAWVTATVADVYDGVF